MAAQAIPRRIGPYSVISALGEGGMGTVYLAEQLEPIRRTVALKVISDPEASDEIVARFMAERQALAVMDHPSIAKVFDAGVTEDGRPFFVMELVEGDTILRYADKHRLSIRGRVALFATVCRAVQHAHQKGVIHRDLKPSNILVSHVDGRPLPRIIDFGIAKAMSTEEFDGTRLTRDDQVIGTPAYMSPEQINGSTDIDTRSDLYALGVVLYELLAGALPFEPGAYRGWAAVAAHLHRDPPTPARRLDTLGQGLDSIAELRATTPRLLRKELGGDLGWVVSRAMARNREERYETANGLALDLERLLADEPVRARGAGTAYVVRKFVRRHRLSVAFAATSTLGLMTFAALMTVQADRVARARDEAEGRRRQAEGLIDFMLGDLRAKLEPLGRLEILDAVGQQAITYFSSLPAEQFSDGELQSRSQALYQIGSVRLNQGESAEAVEAFQESLRLAGTLARRDPQNVERIFGLSQSHFWVGYAAWLKGDLETAEQQFEAYLTEAEQLVALDPEKPEYRMEVGFAHSNLGSVREAGGDLDGAVEAYKRTLAVKEDLVRRDSANVDWLGELAETHNTLGVVYRRQGHYEQALAEHTKELEVKEHVLRLAPTHAYWRRRLAWTYCFLGRIRTVEGDLPGALSSFDAALNGIEGVVALDASNLVILRDRAVFRADKGRTLSLSGLHEEALRALRDALTDLEDLVGRDSSRIEWQRTLGMTRTEYAMALLRAGRPASSLGEADTGRAVLISLDSTDRANLSSLAGNDLVRGHALEALGRKAEAKAARESALPSLLSLVSGPGGEEFRPALAEALLSLDRIPEADEQLDVLRGQGYRDPALWGLAKAKNVPTAPRPGNNS